MKAKLEAVLGLALLMILFTLAWLLRIEDPIGEERELERLRGQLA